MRSLEECKAEIFRRSNERIKRRKRNQRLALSIIIPAFSAIILGSGFLIPKVANDKSTEMLNGQICDTAEAGIQSQITMAPQADGNQTGSSVENNIRGSLEEIVSEAFGTKNNSDSSSVTGSVDRYYESISDVPDGITVTQAQPEEDYDEITAEDQKTDEEALITFSVSDQSYILKGNILTRASTGEAVTLSQEQLTALMSALGF